MTIVTVEQQILNLQELARGLEEQAYQYREQANELRFGLQVGEADQVCTVYAHIDQDRASRVNGRWQLIFHNHKGQDYCRLNPPLSDKTFEIMTLDEVKVWAHQTIKKNSDLATVRIEWF